MPEHMHLLVSETPNATPSIVLHRLKLRVAKIIDGQCAGWCTGDSVCGWLKSKMPP
ncbi:MAG: hypothetical protein JSS69_09225 [Acidobacteria bacterium]|nr:hypothetical protein [Acidobacteriota bacterium]MBS1866087.1 hypothetical protein [Acidobacteriota bacterium]